MLILLALAHARAADGTCDNDGFYTCETYYSAVSVTGTNASDDYSTCGLSSGGWDGYEVSRSIYAANLEHIHLTAYSTAGGSHDPDLIVQEDGCGTVSNTCVDYDVAGGLYAELDWVSNASTYWVTVDDWNPAGNYTFDMDVTCDGICSTTNVQKTISCSSDEAGSTSTGSDVLNYYHTCGSPYSDLLQREPESIYQFRPQSSGSVTFRLSGMTTDQDLYVLGSTCTPDSCLTGSTAASTATDQVTFAAAQGQTYYIVIEAFDGPSTYTLSFDTSNTGGCHEDCNDGADNDSDGAIDCLDTDCATDAVCCDQDADGYARTGTCGGGDCNDASAAIHPNATETCNTVDDDCDSLTDEGVQTTYYRDLDADGYGNSSSGSSTGCTAPSGYVTTSTDCNDGSSSVHPGATEYCNSVDDDCDGSVDEGAVNPTTWYRDQDGDNYGLASTTQSACTRPTGYSAASGDCVDTNASIYPGATEACNGVDDDCDSSVDEGVKTTYYRDADADSYGTTATTQQACSAPSGYVANSTDCNDAAASVHPGATETCNVVDDDCDGSVDEGLATTWYRDADGDTYGTSAQTSSNCAQPSGYVANSSDCNDGNAAIRPGATETCNGVDDNCDGSVDNNASNATTWYRDADNDAYGVSSTTQTACSAPSGYVGTSGDCNDGNAAIKPGATEVCNLVDDDCDALTDEGVQSTWYRDADSDGYGVSSTTQAGCTAPTGYVGNSTDCNDAAAAIHPNATETCNLTDDDCDGSVDEGVQTTWYTDNDADNYGQSGSTVLACTRPTGTAAAGGDCDDTRATAYPGATEYCNGLDDDCDGAVDDNPQGLATWYRDADGDSWGVSTNTQQACSAPAGYVAASGDCDDGRSSAYPGATEVCNSLDDDCDGVADDNASNASTWYRDADADGYGVSSTTQASCSQPSGYVATAGDCNDANAAIKPGATEVCNSVDDDCDSTIDEGVLITFYRDADSDAYGASAVTTTACTAPSGYVASSTDCNDAVASIHPNATETCNGIDDDCDGAVDDNPSNPSTWYRDQDGDAFGGATTSLACSAPSGFVGTGGDCDDTRGSVYPGATETCNTIDDDCDGSVDENASGATTWYRDADNDAYGVSSSTTTACSAPSGYVGNALDCDDTRNAVHPNATETCNALDDDCDGFTDENVTTTFFRDADADSYGTSATSLAACAAPSGYVANSTDCNDAVASVHPGATEVCDLVDQDCDGSVDEGAQTAFYRDADADGYGNSGAASNACTAPTGYVASNTDCDDGDGAIHPNAAEVCNGLDDDCDAQVDESVASAPIWYLDADADAHGVSTTTRQQCTRPSGYVASSDDCDDFDGTVYPGATEVCDGLDNDCDGVADDNAVGLGSWYYDGDADGYGQSGTLQQSCSRPSGYVNNAADCDDTDVNVNPAAPEICDDRDDDCDGFTDEDAVDATDWFADTDGDGFGDGPAVASCDAPSNHVAGNTDCDDTVATTFPGADELCNGVDDDCDGYVDDGVLTTWWLDTDGDGYGRDATSVDACTQPSGYADQPGDCDDAVSTTNPGADEVCNGADDDCDGVIDGGAVDASTWYADVDADGFGATGTGVSSCDGTGLVANGLDCDDADATVNPAAAEICNAADDDCDGSIDTGAVDATDWYVDADADGFGDPTRGNLACTGASGEVADATDCDDAAPGVNPGATEVCNFVDDDCDGLVDDGASDSELSYDDADGDGWGDAATAQTGCRAGGVAVAGDCDDADATVSPGSPEIPYDGLDQDCDGLDLLDVDGDGFVADVAGGDDCADNDASVYPGAPEDVDGVDQNCNAIVDEGTDAYDDDGDGYAELGGDCDDADETRSPVGSETCDGFDQDCDGVVDEGTECVDDDGDGFAETDGDCNDGDAAVGPSADEVDGNGVDDDCDGSVDGGAFDPDGDGYTSDGGDCDPTAADVFPGAPEAGDGVDNDCDGVVDEGTDVFDDDGDGWTEAFGDCNDADADVHTDATEIPDNGVDDDCDGAVDEGGPLSDDDGDGYSEVGGDCDDFDSDVFPAAEEIENHVDDDCDGLVDEDFVDQDGDGYTPDEGDCDDEDGWTNPRGSEFCDDVDNDCDGDVDEACSDTDVVVTDPGGCGCGKGESGILPLMALAGLLGGLIRRRR